MEKKQNVPALRFQGFSGEWEKKTLGDFGNVAMNRRIFKEQTSETGEIPFIKLELLEKNRMLIFPVSCLKNIKQNIPIQMWEIFYFLRQAVLENGGIYRKG